MESDWGSFGCNIDLGNQFENGESEENQSQASYYRQRYDNDSYDSDEADLSLIRSHSIVDGDYQYDSNGDDFKYHPADNEEGEEEEAHRERRAQAESKKRKRSHQVTHTHHKPGTVGYRRAMEASHGAFKLDGSSAIEKHKFPEMEYMNPIYYFYAYVLRWDDINELSRALGIQKKPDVFVSDEAYYAYWRHFALEEARAVLSEGMKSGKQCFSPPTKYSHGHGSSRDAPNKISISFYRASKNIAVQKLNAQLCIADFHINKVSGEHWQGDANTGSSKPSMAPSFRASDTYTAAQLNDFVRPGSIFELQVAGPNGEPAPDALEGKIIFATLFSGTERGRGILRLLLCTSNWESIDQRYRQDAQQWVLFMRASVISEQRTFVCCQERPAVPFLHNILGGKPAAKKNTYFDQDGSVVVPLSQEAEDVDPLTDFNDDRVMGDELNESQKGALMDGLSVFDNFLGRKHSRGAVRLVHGPPGCGKTHYLTALLRRSVLKLEGWPFLSAGAGSGLGGRFGAAHEKKKKHIEQLSIYGYQDVDIKKVSEPFTNKAVLEKKWFDSSTHLQDKVQQSNPCFLVSAPSNKAVTVLLEEYLRTTQGSTLSNARCCLIGVEDKLRGATSTGGYSMKDRQDMERREKLVQGASMFSADSIIGKSPTARPSAHKMLYRILYPETPEDCFVYTLSKRLAAAVWRMLEELDEDRFAARTRAPLAEKLFTDVQISQVTGLSPVELEILVSNIEFPRSQLILWKNAALLRLWEAVKVFDNVYRRMVAHVTELFSTEPLTLEEPICEGVTEALNALQKAMLFPPQEVLEQLKGPESNEDKGDADLVDLNTIAKMCANSPAKDADLGLKHEFGDLKRGLIKLYNTLRSDTISRMFVNQALSTANVVFCTLTQCGSQPVQRNLYDRVEVLFVDEAGQASEAALLITYGLLPKNIILVGDPHQLPAFITSETGQRNGCSESLMARLINAPVSFPCHLLDTQYRMHPEICRLPNRLFYAGKLKDSQWVQAHRPNEVHKTMRDSLVKNGKNNLPAFLQGHVAFIDVAGNEAGGRGGQSISNYSEALLIARMCKYLQDLCGIHLRRQVCVITFYSAQAALIQAELRKLGLGDNLRYCVSTVDSFQGSESDIVILSFVRSNVHDTVGFVRNMQRLNVSITRSKHLLLMMGNAATLGGNSGRASRTSSGSGSPRGSQEQAAYDFTGAEKVTGALEQLVQDARERNILFDGLSVEQCIEPPPPPPPRPPPPPLNAPHTLNAKYSNRATPAKTADTWVNRNQPFDRHVSKHNNHNNRGNSNYDTGRTGNGGGGGGGGGVHGRTFR